MEFQLNARHLTPREVSILLEEGCKNFDGCTIIGSVVYNGVTEGGLSFVGTKILGNLNLEDAIISGNLNLSGAHVYGRIFMSRTRVKGNVSMPHIRVREGLVLCKAHLEKSLFLNGAKIEYVDLKDAVIDGKTHHDEDLVLINDKRI